MAWISSLNACPRPKCKSCSRREFGPVRDLTFLTRCARLGCTHALSRIVPAPASESRPFSAQQRPPRSKPAPPPPQLHPRSSQRCLHLSTSYDRALPHATASSNSCPHVCFLATLQHPAHPSQRHLILPLFPTICVTYKWPSPSRSTGLAPCRLGSHPLLFTLKLFIAFSASSTCYYRHWDVV